MATHPLGMFEEFPESLQAFLCPIPPENTAPDYPTTCQGGGAGSPSACKHHVANRHFRRLWYRSGHQLGSGLFGGCSSGFPLYPFMRELLVLNLTNLESGKTIPKHLEFSGPPGV